MKTAVTVVVIAAFAIPAIANEDMMEGGDRGNGGIIPSSGGMEGGDSNVGLPSSLELPPGEGMEGGNGGILSSGVDC